MPEPYEQIKIPCVGPNGEDLGGVIKTWTLHNAMSWEAPAQPGYSEILYDVANSPHQSRDSEAPNWILVRHARQPELQDFGADAVDQASQARILTGRQAHQWFLDHSYSPPRRCSRQVETFPDLDSRVGKAYDAASSLVSLMYEAARKGLDQKSIDNASSLRWTIEASWRAEEPRIPPRLPRQKERPPSCGTWLEEASDLSHRLERDWKMSREQSDPSRHSKSTEKAREFAGQGLTRLVKEIAIWDLTAMTSRLLNEKDLVVRELDAGHASERLAGPLIPEDRTRRGATLEIRTDKLIVCVSGHETRDLTEAQHRVLTKLAKAEGKRIPGSELKEFSESSENPSRIVDRLPDEIKELIDRRKGHGGGYRLACEVIWKP